MTTSSLRKNGVDDGMLFSPCDVFRRQSSERLPEAERGGKKRWERPPANRLSAFILAFQCDSVELSLGLVLLLKEGITELAIFHYGRYTFSFAISL